MIFKIVHPKNPWDTNFRCPECAAALQVRWLVRRHPQNVAAGVDCPVCHRPINVQVQVRVKYIVDSR